MRTTGTIFLKSNLLLCVFEISEQNLELVLVVSQDPVWYEEKAGEVDLIEERCKLFFFVGSYLLVRQIRREETWYCSKHCGLVG